MRGPKHIVNARNSARSARPRADCHSHLSTRADHCGPDDQGRISRAERRGWQIALHEKGGNHHVTPARPHQFCEQGQNRHHLVGANFRSYREGCRRPKSFVSRINQHIRFGHSNGARHVECSTNGCAIIPSICQPEPASRSIFATRQSAGAVIHNSQEERTVPISRSHIGSSRQAVQRAPGAIWIALPHWF